MLREIYERLAADLGISLGITVVKGFPSWGRPGLEPPLASLETTDYTAERPARIGRIAGRRRAGFILTVFGRHEAEMADLVEQAVAWFLDNSRFTVNGIAVDCEMPTVARHVNESGVQQEAYACALTCVVTWSE